MKKYFSLFSILIFALLFYSCEKSNPVTTMEPNSKIGFISNHKMITPVTEIDTPIFVLQKNSLNYSGYFYFKHDIYIACVFAYNGNNLIDNKIFTDYYLLKANETISENGLAIPGSTISFTMNLKTINGIYYQIIHKEQF